MEYERDPKILGTEGAKRPKCLTYGDNRNPPVNPGIYPDATGRC